MGISVSPRIDSVDPVPTRCCSLLIRFVHRSCRSRREILRGVLPPILGIPAIGKVPYDVSECRGSHSGACKLQLKGKRRDSTRGLDPGPVRPSIQSSLKSALRARGSRRPVDLRARRCGVAAQTRGKNGGTHSCRRDDIIRAVDFFVSGERRDGLTDGRADQN
jgi:hypothetical protein